MTSAQRYHELRVGGRFDPLQAVTRLADSGLFDPYVAYEQDDDWWFAGGALGEVTVSRSRLSTRWRDQLTTRPLPARRPLARVRQALAAMPVGEWRVYGWAAFELAYLTAGRRQLVADDRALLDLVVPHTEVRLRAGQALVRSASRAVMRQVWELVAAPADGAAPAPTQVPVDRDDDAADAYEAAVASAVREIRAQRLEKVIVSRCVPVGFPVDLVGTYALGRARNTPARSFLLQLGGRRAAGFSPETVIEVGTDGRVLTQPLAGTRALGFGRADDTRLRADLLSDPKEVFEHALSVKVAHDELLALCLPGSVAVRDLMTVRERGTVQHLGSTVSGRLRPERSSWDALEALFPAVTASGVPKRQAYEQIVRLEDEPRDLYGGAVLVAGSDGSMDAALVLRAIYQAGGRAWLRAGAGVVGASVPAREYQETCEKLRSVALHVVRDGERARHPGLAQDPAQAGELVRADGLVRARGAAGT